jgi:hypothetical protein
MRRFWHVSSRLEFHFQTYHVEDGSRGVGGGLILGRISDQALVVRESDPTWRYPVTLVVDEYLN